MKSKFRHVALIGKYQASLTGGTPALTDTLRDTLLKISRFLIAQGCEVAIESETAHHSGISEYPALDVAAIGAH